jgi:(p)ppGpp synthase/HD superfamily hydrolase
MTFSQDRYLAALHFAADRHRGQLVPGGERPYVVHVTSVAMEVIAALADARDPDLAVACALLHDTIEDTATTYDEVAAAFGASVADGVRALSKSAEVPKADRMADSLRRIRMQPREVWMVKLADRITNLQPAPPAWSTEKKRAYRDEAIAIADALGEASPLLHARIRTKIAGYASELPGEPVPLGDVC